MCKWELECTKLRKNIKNENYTELGMNCYFFYRFHNNVLAFSILVHDEIKKIYC